MIDAVRPLPPIVMVESATTHEPTFFFAFMAVGDEGSMKALERAAARSGFPTSRPTNDKGQTEVLVMFPPRSDSRRALSLYNDAIIGKFGKLGLEVTIAPRAAWDDGNIDLDKEVTVEPPSMIAIPQL
jgi:hypothetical protein